MASSTFPEESKMIRKSLLALSAVSAFALVGGSAVAAPEPRVEDVVSNQVEGGWERLGVREVDGKLDRDVIEVGARDGHFRAIQIQVDGSAIEMFEIKVTFGDGQVFEPSTRLVFDKDSKSRVIDLPGERRIIRRVEFKYGRLSRERRAHVELWARQD